MHNASVTGLCEYHRQEMGMDAHHPFHVLPAKIFAPETQSLIAMESGFPKLVTYRVAIRPFKSCSSLTMAENHALTGTAIGENVCQEKVDAQ